MNRVILTLTASALNKSIVSALQSPPNAMTSIEMIQRALRSLPEGTLYPSDNGNTVSFYVFRNGHQKYLSKKSDLLHPLARKKYLMILLEVLKLTHASTPKAISRRVALISKLQNLLTLYERGNLDLSRVVLTSRQHKWFTNQFHQKHMNESDVHAMAYHLPFRSKSERDITNGLASFAVPHHYEEQKIIYVQPLVENLRSYLQNNRLLQGRLYSIVNGTTRWHVPSALDWMNVRGSIWRSYEPSDGTIELFNDFMIMLADGTILVWEHEGMIDHFIYRCNTSERIAVMKCTGTISNENLIETYEEEIDSPEKIAEIIQRRILPRLWF
ncbi:MAG: hypothetical protein E7221_00685 [Clostridiales bacterium]|nr:hypothetical protein [Clostridiales bacterium]